MTATPNPSRLLDQILRPTDPVRLPPPPLRRQYRIGLGLSQQQVADLVWFLRDEIVDWLESDATRVTPAD